MKEKTKKLNAIALAAALVAGTVPALADEFTKEDLARWEGEYQSVVKKGRELFTDAKLGTNGVVCAQCHPNGANTHPETYPKFQKQIGKVVTLAEMINWCLRNPSREIRSRPTTRD